MQFYTNNIQELAKTIRQMLPELFQEKTNGLQIWSIIIGIIGPAITSVIILVFTRRIQRNDVNKKKELEVGLANIKSELSLTNQRTIQQIQYEYDKAINNITIENNRFITKLTNNYENQRFEADLKTKFRLQVYSKILDEVYKMNEIVQNISWIARDNIKMGSKEFEDKLDEKMRLYQKSIHNSFYYINGDLAFVALNIWSTVLSLLQGRIHSSEWNDEYNKDWEKLEEYSKTYTKILKEKYYFDDADKNVDKILKNIRT
jgi:hypothetical protein